MGYILSSPLGNGLERSETLSLLFERLKSYTPAIVLMACMLISWLVYNLAWRIENDALHQGLGFISGAMLFLSVGFGVFIVYPLMFRKGASLPARLAVSFLTPLAWMIKESALLYISHTAAECLYYLLNPLNVPITLAVFGQMGLSEAVMRMAPKKENLNLARIVVPLFAGIFCFAAAVGLLLWGQGENAYVIFLENYRRLFGSGL